MPLNDFLIKVSGKDFRIYSLNLDNKLDLSKYQFSLNFLL